MIIGERKNGEGKKNLNFTVYFRARDENELTTQTS